MKIRGRLKKATSRSISKSRLSTGVLWMAFPFLIGAVLGVLVQRMQSPEATQAELEAQARRPSQSSVSNSSTLAALAEREAAPLLAELERSPRDPVLLAKVGNIYYVTRNYQQACEYFERSLAAKEDAILRTELGRAYFIAGEIDRALAQFEWVLKADPKNANALFNLGMVRWQSKFDVEGAVAAWQELIRKHPDHPHRKEVEGLIAQARQHMNVQQNVQPVAAPSAR